MGVNWADLDEVDATEFILRSAVRESANCLSIVRDEEGGDIYFGCGEKGEDWEVFLRLPAPTCKAVCRYLKRMAAIDPYKGPPQEGLSAYDLDGQPYTLTVSTVKGTTGEGVVVRISRL